MLGASFGGLFFVEIEENQRALLVSRVFAILINLSFALFQGSWRGKLFNFRNFLEKATKSSSSFLQSNSSKSKQIYRFPFQLSNHPKMTNQKSSRQTNLLALVESAFAPPPHKQDRNNNSLSSQSKRKEKRQQFWKEAFIYHKNNRWKTELYKFVSQCMKYFHDLPWKHFSTKKFFVLLLSLVLTD